MAGELTGPRGDLLRGHSANVLCVLLYAHRIMWLSVLLREDSLCGVSGYHRNWQPVRGQWIRPSRVLSGTSVLPFSSQGSGDNTEEEERFYEPEVRKDGDKTVFWASVLMNSQQLLLLPARDQGSHTTAWPPKSLPLAEWEWSRELLERKWWQFSLGGASGRQAML